MPNFKIDINNDNFNNFFAIHAEKLTEAQKDLLPKELNFKLFKKGGVLRGQNTTSLSFLTKLFVLIRCFKMNWVLLIEHEDGLQQDQFFKIKEVCREEGFGVDPAESWLKRGMFALSGKELMESFAALNKLSVGPAYNFISKVKNVPESRTTEWKKMATYIAQFIANYESKKKKIIMQSGITMPELYTLFYLYDGTQRGGSSIYNEQYKYAYNASRKQIQAAFVTLENKGLISKIGKKKGMKMSITPQGIGIINDVLHKYIIDF